MSVMRMFSINKNGNLIKAAEFGNSHLGWNLMHDFIEKIYMPPAPGRYSIFIESMFDKNVKVDDFWKLGYDSRLKTCHWIAMRCSYDGAMVRKEHFGIVAQALMDTARDMQDPGHLPAIADELGRLAGNDDVIGACWQATSVNADEWGDEGRMPARDGKSRPFNIFKDVYHTRYCEKQYWLDPTDVSGDMGMDDDPVDPSVGWEE